MVPRPLLWNNFSGKMIDPPGYRTMFSCSTGVGKGGSGVHSYIASVDRSYANSIDPSPPPNLVTSDSIKRSSLIHRSSHALLTAMSPPDTL